MSDEPKDPKDPAVEEQDPGEAKGAGKILPFTRFLLNAVRGRGKGKKGEEAERLEDGTIVLSRGRGWTRWIFGTFPIQQITCVACLRQRREDDHEGCGFEQCDCFCMQGKHWPLWAMFGLNPPAGPLPAQFAVTASTSATSSTASRRPRVDAVSAFARHGPPLLFAALTVSTFALAVVAWDSFAPVRARHLGAIPRGASAPTLENMQLPGPSPLLDLAVTGGLKMPDKPDPHWLTPGRDGVCRNPRTSEELRTQAIIRGTCWRVVGDKLPGEPLCPSDLYDPPPEVVRDAKMGRLHEACFRPWTLEAAGTLAPHP